ncbi:glycosyltransferase [Haloferax marisrubri]|uniref:Glycosyltransferase RgtA/B/C/D-like domain-containing protein n=1 Tax=Haloferax marisrubri TaxID=1544719 RepID=A0A2P4NQU2_9EURY|nr:glycosyltransferase [Haloferax marisrubri]POG55517.1 hypothetical protein AUR65_008885 [Haloferax marisrubri]
MRLIWAILNLLGVLFSLAWLWVNLYLHYPLVKALVSRVLNGVVIPATSAETQPERVLQPDGKVTDGGSDVAREEPLEFDVLLPAYAESSVIENSIRSVRAADYPQSRINLVILTEPDDDETRATLTTLAQQYEFTELCVPERYPGDQNKPRALNYGFEKTDSDVVAVIDAENVFHPDIFTDASARFRDADVDFLQGRLDMVNEDDGWLNTFFRAEYGYWYRVIFPRFFGANYPIPMGGTTCLFRRSVLAQISDARRERYDDPWSDTDYAWATEHDLVGARPWDPENVTEDFELGLFLWQNGFTPGYLSDPVTDEESPLTLSSWMGQRTRWQKGKIYTLLHYLRYPPDTARERVHLYTQSAIPHLGVVNILALFTILLAANLGGYTWHSLPTSLLLVGLGFLGLTMVEYGIGYWVTSKHPRRTRFRRAMVVIATIPFYWVLHWLADIRAFARTYRGEFHWVKTAHAGRNTTAAAADTSEVTDQRSQHRWTLSRRTNIAALGVVVGVALAVRLYNITAWSLFNDELYSIGRASAPIAELLFVTHDTHPPLHYLLLHYWMDFFGQSQLSVRSLSVVFSVATVVAVYLLGVELYNDRTGLAAALVTALSVYHVHYAQNARMYTLVAFLTAVSWYGFVVMKSSPHRGSLIYGPATALLIYTHLWAVFVILAQNIYVLFSNDRTGLDLRRWGRAQFLIGLCTIPVVAFYLSAIVSSDGAQALIAWLQPPSLYNIVELVRQFAGVARQYPLVDGTGLSVPVAIVTVFIYALLVFTAVVRYDSVDGFELTDLDSAGQLALLVLVPIVVPFILSYVFVPMFFYRYAAPASIGLFILVGKGIDNIETNTAAALVVAVLVVASGVMLSDHYNNTTVENIDGAMACLDSETTTGDLVIVQTFWGADVEQTPLSYYDVFSTVNSLSLPPPDRLTAQDVTEMEAAVAEHDTVWVVMFAAGDVGDQLTAWTTDSRVLQSLNQTHTQLTLMDGTTVNVYRYESADRAATGGQDSRAVSHACAESQTDDADAASSPASTASEPAQAVSLTERQNTERRPLGLVAPIAGGDH